MHNPQLSFSSDSENCQCKEFELNSNYIVYEDGRILSRYTYQFLTSSVDNSRYKRISLKVGGKAKKCLLHRIVAMTFIPNPEELEYVNHIDGNKLNNHVSNLEWVTASGNQKHAYKIGLKSSVGSKNARAILTEAEVLAIHERMMKGESSPSIAADLGIKVGICENIRAHRQWKNVLQFLPRPPKPTRKNALKVTDAEVIQIAEYIMQGKSYLKIVADSDGKFTKSLVEAVRHHERYKHLTNSIFYPEESSTTIESAKKVA